jgi:hypothetical protein
MSFLRPLRNQPKSLKESRAYLLAQLSALWRALEHHAGVTCLSLPPDAEGSAYFGIGLDLDSSPGTATGNGPLCWLSLKWRGNVFR